MRHLHLPGTQHLFYVGDHLLEREGVIEVVARREVGPNFFRGHPGQDGAVRNVGLQLREVRPNFIDEHVELLPPPKSKLRDLNANAAHLNAVIEFLVEAGEYSRFQVVKIDGIMIRNRIESQAHQLGFRILEGAGQVHVFSNA